MGPIRGMFMSEFACASVSRRYDHWSLPRRFPWQITETRIRQHLISCNHEPSRFPPVKAMQKEAPILLTSRVDWNRPSHHTFCVPLKWSKPQVHEVHFFSWSAPIRPSPFECFLPWIWLSPGYRFGQFSDRCPASDREGLEPSFFSSSSSCFSCQTW